MNESVHHWDVIYRETAEQQLGWYEDDPAPMFRLLNRISGWEESRIFLPGAGTSVLVDRLAESKAALVLNDISPVALDVLKTRLGERGHQVEWSCQSIAEPLSSGVAEVDIWIDRAVLHFLTQEREIEDYFRNVRAKLKVGGYALFAEFPPHGAARCAGVDLHRYSLEELSQRLGDCFALIDSFDYCYINPDGDSRPYLYALFERINQGSEAATKV